MSLSAGNIITHLKLVRLPLFLAVCLALIALTVRVPGGIWVLIPAVFLFGLLFTSRECSVPEWVLLYSLALLSGLRVVSVMLYHGGLLDALMPLSMLGVGIVMVSVSLPSRRFLSASVLVGFFLIVFLGLWEIISAQSLAITRYGHSVLSSIVLHDRFVVSAFFPNYNDYSVVLFFVVAFFLVKLLDHRVSLFGKTFLVVLLLLSVFHGLYMGSRGFQLAVVVSVFFLILVKANGVWRVLIPLSAVLFLFAAMSIFASEFTHYFYDTSSEIRLRTLRIFGEVLLNNPIAMLFGFPSLSVYTGEMIQFCELCLVDPHNLILEIIAMHGIFGIIIFLVLLLYALRFIFSKMFLEYNMLGSYFALLIVTSPIWGVVSSSSLRYSYIYVFAIFFVGLVSIGRCNTRSFVSMNHYHRCREVEWH